MGTIYLVDDHIVLRDGVQALLEAAGHRVVGASADPAQALAELQALGPSLLLLDLNLGPHSGLELLERIQALGLPLRTVVLTMSAQPRDVAAARRLGALGYVLKGGSANELLAAVDAVLQGRPHLAPDSLATACEPAAHDNAGFAGLSPRERQVVLGVVQGRSSAAIAEQLQLSPKTVDSYRSRLMAKLGVADVPALVRLAVREGWADLDAE